MAYNMRDDIKEVYFTEEQLHEKVAELGARITEDYRDKNPLIVSVLKGSYVFMADLTRAIDTPCNVDFMVVSSYGKGTKTRFRPHHFPFTEPSCEMDVQCHKCGGVGCPTCKGEGWIEVLGAGMIHPKVLEGCGIDSTVYSGWAFGMGLERLALGHFKISDLRLIFENDVRFLEQF